MFVISPLLFLVISSPNLSFPFPYCRLWIKLFYCVRAYSIIYCHCIIWCIYHFYYITFICVLTCLLCMTQYAIISVQPNLFLLLLILALLPLLWPMQVVLFPVLFLFFVVFPQLFSSFFLLVFLLLSIIDYNYFTCYLQVSYSKIYYFI